MADCAVLWLWSAFKDVSFAPMGCLDKPQHIRLSGFGQTLSLLWSYSNAQRAFGL